MDSTIKFYDDNAEEFGRQNIEVPMEHLYESFLHHIPAGGKILDAGCGPGRDSKAFLVRGYRVVAFDAAESMVAAASEFVGQKVMRLRFQDLEFEKEFDGVWACASLLHVNRDEIDAVLQRLVRATKHGGVLYMSFKYGDAEGFKDRRFFNDYNECTLQQLIDKLPGCQTLSVWQTADARPCRSHERWVNALLLAP